MDYQAVLFDLDGTLLNTLDDLADCMNRVLGRLGYAAHPVEDYRYFVGDGMEMLAARALPSGLSQEKVIQCSDAMKKEYDLHWADKTRPYPGISQLLDGLMQRQIKLAVLSNKPDPFTKDIISTFLSKWHFHPVIGARPGVPKKPDPAVALEIAKDLKILPEQFLYLGDTNTDMKTAVAAGMFPVGVLWGFRTAEELMASGANLLLHNPPELMKFL
ncbi:MAG TPA: HAD family hydrolase [Firmicutes bacterium]|jgi:phosphoglycolate phosphatase|nr:HAD family hydrolase [Bacillota bacterium]